MPFPWLLAETPADLAATFHHKALEMHRQEVRQRAALLLHLGYSQEEATARCRQNLEWDFDLSHGNSLLGEVDDLVKEVYRRR